MQRKCLSEPIKSHYANVLKFKTLVCGFTGPHSTVGIASLTADPGVAGLIPARSHTSWRLIRHEMISKVIISYFDSRRFVASYKRKYVHRIG